MPVATGGDWGMAAYGFMAVAEVGLEGGDVTRGGGAGPFGGGPTGGVPLRAATGGPGGGGPWKPVGDWLGKGELIAVVPAGVDLRGAVGRAKPSGRSFHAGRFVAVVYVVTVVAGDWLEARGGGGIEELYEWPKD